MWGTPIIRSISQLTTASTFGPPSAAAAPSTTAIAEETQAATNPKSTLVESPASVRASISRPIQSVPKGCSKLGANAFNEKSTEVALAVSAMPNATTSAKRNAANRNLSNVAMRFASMLRGA